MNGLPYSLTGQAVGHKMKSDTENKMSARRLLTNRQASFPVFTAVFLVDRPITALSRAKAHRVLRQSRRNEGGRRGLSSFPIGSPRYTASCFLASSGSPLRLTGSGDDELRNPTATEKGVTRRAFRILKWARWVSTEEIMSFVRVLSSIFYVVVPCTGHGREGGREGEPLLSWDCGRQEEEEGRV